MEYQLPERNQKLAETILSKFPTFTAFSYVVGDSESLVSKIVNGWRPLSEGRACKWSQVLGCSESDLFN